MIGKTERNRIIRLKRQANYLRARAEQEELTAKQRAMTLGSANAITWAIGMVTNSLEHREKMHIHDRMLDKAISWLQRRKYNRNRARYDAVEQDVRDAYMSDIMEHEKAFDSIAAQVEAKAADKDKRVQIA